jgi:branched-chain amino acid transport system substrate-binding protein
MSAAVGIVNAAGGIHGRRVQLLVKDDKYDVPTALIQTQQLAQQSGVVAFLGGQGTNIADAQLPLVAQLKIPDVGPVAYDKKLYSPPSPYFFPLWPGQDAIYRTVVKAAAAQLSIHSAAILVQPGDVGSAALEGANRGASEAKVSITGRITYQDGPDYTGVLGQATSKNPDALIVQGTTSGLAAIATTLKRLNYKGVLLGGVTTGTDNFPRLAGAAANGAYGVLFMNTYSGKQPGWKPYVAAVRKYGNGSSPNDIYTASGYVAGQVLLSAIKKVHGKLTPQAINNVLEHSTFSTLAGKVNFPANYRLGINRIIVTKVVNGHITITGKPITVPRD